MNLNEFYQAFALTNRRLQSVTNMTTMDGFDPMEVIFGKGKDNTFHIPCDAAHEALGKDLVEKLWSSFYGRKTHSSYDPSVVEMFSKFVGPTPSIKAFLDKCPKLKDRWKSDPLIEWAFMESKNFEEAIENALLAVSERTDSVIRACNQYVAGVGT